MKLRRRKPSGESQTLQTEETTEVPTVAEELDVVTEVQEEEEDSSEANMAEVLAELREELTQLHEELAEMCRQTKAAQVNGHNREQSAGKLTSGKSEEYFTLDEVRAMSPEAVRVHYDRIIDSMRHWH